MTENQIFIAVVRASRTAKRNEVTLTFEDVPLSEAKLFEAPNTQAELVIALTENGFVPFCESRDGTLIVRLTRDPSCMTRDQRKERERIDIRRARNVHKRIR